MTRTVITATIITIALFVIVSLTPAKQYALLAVVAGALYVYGPVWYQTYLQHQQVGYAKRAEERDIARIQEEQNAKTATAAEEDRERIEAAKQPNLFVELNGLKPGVSGAIDLPRESGSEREYNLTISVRNAGDKEAPSYNLDLIIPRRYTILEQTMPNFPPQKFTVISGTTDGTYSVHYKGYNSVRENGGIQQTGTVRLQLRREADVLGDDSATLSWRAWSQNYGFAFNGHLEVRFLA